MKKTLIIISLIVSNLCFSQAPINGLVGYFNFENTLNSNFPTHSFTNGTTTNVTYSTGYYGQGVSFTGAEALVNQTIPNAASLGVNSTVAWWEFRPIGIPTNFSSSFEMGEVMYYRAQNNSGCTGTNYANRYEYGLGLPTGWVCQTLQQQSAMAGSWHHHAFTKVGGVVNYYLDGNLNISGWLLNDTGMFFATNKFVFGGGTNSGTINAAKCMNGKLDELYVYDRALTAAEITLIKNSSYTSTLEPIISNISSIPTTTNATINYSINANGYATTSIIKYGTSSSALTSQITGGNASGTTTTPLNSTISSLTPSTTYYYQIEATNSVGTSTNTIQSFTTTSIPTLIAQYDFNNTYTNILGSAPFSTTSGSFVADRNGNPTSALNIANTGATATILNLPYGASARTISIWIKMNSIDPNYNFVYNYGSATGYYGVYFNPSTIFHFAASGGNHSNASAIAVNQWVHYVFSYDGVQSKIYKNGVLLNTSPKSWNTINNSNLFRLGLTESGNSNYFNAAVDDLKIYNYVISDADATSLYSNNVLSSEKFNSQNLKATIYPNPASTNFTIEMENEVKSVEIYSIQGQKVLTSKAKNVNVSNLSKGMYLVRIEDTNNTIATQKLIIK